MTYGPIELTGFTLQGDDVVEWCEEDLPEKTTYRVDLNRGARGLKDISFNFSNRASARSFFIALCDVISVYVEGE